MQLSFLRPLYDRPGPWVSVYLDASANTEDAHPALDLRWRALRDQLQEQHADVDTIAAVERLVRGHDPMPGDYGLAVFGTRGRVVLSEYLSAPPLRDLAAYTPLPHVMPLLAQRGEQVAWVRVLADRTGADAMAISAGGVPRRAHVTGREDFQLRRVRPGGWSQSRYQRAAMEAWHNAGDVTAATVELAERVGAEVVVVAGDVRATGMIAAQMPPRWQDMMVRTDAGSRAGGAEQTLLDDLTVQTIAEVADQRITAALDRFGMQEDVGAGLDAVVSALQRNQVETMLMVDDPSATGELWIGPEPTEIATDPGQLAAMSVRDPAKVRADAALVRALVGTDAELTVLGPDEAPELTDGVGAVLRYVDAGTPGVAMAERTVADLVVERLRAWRVPRVFGYPGEAIAPVVEALDTSGGDPAFVPARHEETASYMATGHAKFTGGIGVCLATQGPSAVQLLNGLYDAKLDSKPVVAIVGEDVSGPLGGAHQEIGLSRLFADVCNQFVRYGRLPDGVPTLLDQAFRTAAATRSPVCVVLPRQLQEAGVPDLQSHAAGVLAATPGEPLARVLPHEADLDAAAQVLANGQRTAILVGQGARGAAGDLVALADRLGAGVAASLLGKPVLDERLPFHAGVLGEVGTPAAAELMGGCDTLLMVGTNNPWTDYLPMPGQVRTVQIDIDGRRIGTRYPVDVPLVGDAQETLRALLTRVPDRPNARWRETVEGSVDRWRGERDERASAAAEPVNPQLVMRELSSRVPRRGAVAVDVGSVIYWYARHLELPPGVNAQLCGTLGSMGCALPYAVSAKLAAPDQPVIALLGDGAMQLNGLAELITVAHHWRDWHDPRLVVLVLNNRDQSGMGGGRSPTDPTHRRPDVPYAGWARLLGLHGVRVDRPELVGAAWDEALAADRPCVLEAVVDQAVPLAPPEPALADLRAVFADGEAARRVRDRTLAARVAVEADEAV